MTPSSWPSGFLRTHPPTPSQARGLLLFQAQNRALLERVIQAVNEKQKTSGELARVTEREHGGTTYHMRESPPIRRVRRNGTSPIRTERSHSPTPNP